MWRLREKANKMLAGPEEPEQIHRGKHTLDQPRSRGAGKMWAKKEKKGPVIVYHSE